MEIKILDKSEAAISLAALRKTETKTCPECGENRIAVVRATDLCKKCKSKLLMRARKLENEMNTYRIDYKYSEINNANTAKKWEHNFSIVKALSEDNALAEFKKDWTAKSELIIKSIDLV